MSVSSTIDVKFGAPRTSAYEIVVTLIESGWSIFYDRSITLLPLNDDDRFSWKSIPGSDAALAMGEIKDKSDLGEMVGIVLTWQDSGCGGEFLVDHDGTFSFVVSINRRMMLDCGRVTDISWYVEKLFKSFASSPLKIESITWSEHY